MTPALDTAYNGIGTAVSTGGGGDLPETGLDLLPVVALAFGVLVVAIIASIVAEFRRRRALRERAALRQSYRREWGL